ncbi:MAG: hypothetical protein SFU99_03915 [Saprospiraceae bacterium]|nr:hypothetical protein [Saprospiraceae bacterium]
MVQSQEIKVIFDNTLIEHTYFNYLPHSRRVELETLIKNKEAVICGFYNLDDGMLFVAAFQIYPESVHVREVGGNFGRCYDVLDIFAQGFAKYMGKNSVTFDTEKRAVHVWANKSGYIPTPDSNEYRKVLH